MRPALGRQMPPRAALKFVMPAFDRLSLFIAAANLLASATLFALLGRYGFHLY